MTEGSSGGRVVGVVPAAGASTRMGRAKALLEVEGVTFLRRVVRALSDGGCSAVVVVVPEGSDDIAREAGAAGATVLTNPDPGEGPVTSLRLAIDALANDVDAIAYLPVDHPLVSADSVAELIQAFRSSGSPLALPTFGEKRGHPAIFARVLFDDLLDPMLEGGARTVVHRHLASAFILASEDPGVIADIDTPDDYRSVLDASEGGQR